MGEGRMLVLFVELLSAFIVLIGAIITGILYWANVYSLQGIIIPITVMVALYESLMLLNSLIVERLIAIKYLRMRQITQLN